MKLQELCKKGAAVAVGALMLLGISSCNSSVNEGNSSSDGVSDTAVATDEIDKSSVRYIANYGNLTRYTPQNKLNPEEVYKGLTYTPEMFCGVYSFTELYKDGSIDYKSEKASEYYEKSSQRLIYKGGFSYNVSSLPVEISSEYSGGDSGSTSFTFIGDDNTIIYVEGTFTVEEDKVIFKPDDYTFAGGADTLKFSFSFKGDALTLTSGDDSITLNATALMEGTDGGFSLIGESQSSQLDNIASMEMCNKSGAKFFNINLNNSDSDNDSVRNAVGYFYDNGLFDFSWSDENGTVFSYEFVYFMGGSKGIVLTDGKEAYRFA